MYEEIKKLIKKKKNDIDDDTLRYFTNYFYVAVKTQVIPSQITLESAIENALNYARKIEFYDETYKVYLENGGDTKGFRDPKSKTIYIRNNLEEPLREMTVYHELHHATQTNPENDMVGINQKSNIGRLIMEAQTQYFAERVYEEIHGIKFSEREIPSENIRMISNGIVLSKLHNYEMYDNLLTKLAIILNVPKDYFVSINYLYKNNEGLKNLETKYNEAKENQKLPYTFNTLLLILDYIYCVDLMAYKKNKDKETILKGGETELYEIHPNKGLRLSLNKQREYINTFDVNYFIALAETNGNFKEFTKYVIDNEKKSLIVDFLKALQNQSQESTPKRKS